MSDAVFYRKGVGDLDEAIADTRVFIAAVGRRRAGDAARAFFSLGQIYEQRAGLTGP